MKNNWTPKKLEEFNTEIIKIYESGKIRAPIHLSGSTDGKQEEFLIKFFRDNNINENTWLFGTWRSHFLWLLSGRNPEELKKQIIEGHSMHIYGHKFFTSAIVGGIAPIALGVAMGIKKNNSNEKVYCFLGCMGSLTGLATECIRYACGYKLPIIYVIENNDLSVTTLTLDSYGCETCLEKCDLFNEDKDCVIKYDYIRKYNHAGSALNGEKRFILF